MSRLFRYLQSVIRYPERIQIVPERLLGLYGIVWPLGGEERLPCFDSNIISDYDKGFPAGERGEDRK